MFHKFSQTPLKQINKHWLGEFTKYLPNHDFKMKRSQIILGDRWKKPFLTQIQKHDDFSCLLRLNYIYLHVRAMKIVSMTQISILIMFRRLQLSKYAVISDFSGPGDVLLTLKK